MQPISRLPLIGSMIAGMLQDAEEHHQNLLQAAPKPEVLDDYTVGRVFEVSAGKRTIYGCSRSSSGGGRRTNSALASAMKWTD
jgi:hypothetical protein